MPNCFSNCPRAYSKLPWRLELITKAIYNHVQKISLRIGILANSTLNLSGLSSQVSYILRLWEEKEYFVESI